MNRSGTTLLTGTLIASLWLAPAGRMSRDAAASRPVTSGSAIQTSGTSDGQGRTNGTGREVSLDEIKRRGEDGYKQHLQRVITHVCQARDYEINFGKETEVANEEKKQELLEEKKGDDPKCRVPGNFIIALVPDPVHTHLALAFDRIVDVIEEAAQDEGYTFDHAIMPWDSKTHIESTDYESRLQAEAYQRGREEYPGLIAFRGGGEEHDQRLFVLAVAETPTGGIRRQQFLNAIKVIQDATGIKDLRKDWHPDLKAEPGLRILGPTFSGSLDSLGRILTCWNKEAKAPRKCYPMVSIHSGTISSRANILRFEEEKQYLKIHLVSLFETDNVAVERFVEFLAGTSYEKPQPPFALQRLWCFVAGKKCEPEYPDRRYAARDIAILSEDETAYGEMGGERSKTRPGAESHKNEKEYCETDTAQARHDQDCFLKLYFPREISQLRAAYQDSLSSPAPGDARTPPRDTLPSNFYVPGSDDDTAASYSSKQMPLSQESVMLEIVSELRKHHVKFIILRATDPMDTLFLTRFLRTEYPQGRVVLLGADMLLRREADDPRLHGVLALTPYSLAPSANHHFASFEAGHAERIFPAAREVGVYNAMRVLLNAWVDTSIANIEGCKGKDTSPAEVDCRHELTLHSSKKDRPFPELYQYGWLAEPPDKPYDAPPVLLLALGRDDYWPIAALGPLTGERLLTTLPRVPGQISSGVDKPEVPNSWRIVQLIGILLGVGFSFSLWRASVLAKTQMNAKFAPAALDGRAVVVVLAGLTLILILLILDWPTIANAKPGAVNLGPLIKFTLLGVFVCTCADLVNRTRLARRRSRWGWSWVFTLVAVSAVLVIRVYFLQPEETPASVVRFATYRAMQLTSGLSFIVPTFFFLAVWLWWADNTAAGYALLDHRRPRLPKRMQEPSVQRLGKKELPGLQGALHLTPWSAIGYMSLLALFALVLWRLDTRPHPLLSLERPFLQVAMSIFFTLALGGVILATVRLWSIWLGVRKLLVTLDSLPLRRGFAGVIEGFSWKPVWRIGVGSLDEFQRIFSRLNETLGCALNTYPLPTGSLTKEWTDMMKCWEGLVNMKHKYTRNWWPRRRAELELVRHFGKCQCEISRVAARALDLLARSWAKQTEEPKERVGHETTHDLGVRAWERFVCLVYVNFLLVMLVRIRTLIVAIGGMYVLTMIAITQYPFEPKAAVQLILIVLLVCIVTVVGLVFAQIHRDAILSRITGTNPGELGADFYLRMASFTALPLFSLLASQFPSVNRLFYSWLQPAIQALNR